MIILWFLLLHGVLSDKLSPEENRRLKKECGDSWIHTSSRSQRFADKFIAIGDGVPYGEFPFVAALAPRMKVIIKSPDGMEVGYGRKGGSPSCTGSLISSRHILTAAHCFFNFTGRTCRMFDGEITCSTKNVEKIGFSKTVVILGRKCAYGDHRCWLSESAYKIKQGYIHHRYNYNAISYDLALIELERDVTPEHGKPICMPDVQEVLLNPLMSAGYGYIPTPKDSNPLQMVRYKQHTEDGHRITAFAPDQSLCPGDSGGPLFQFNHQRRNVLVGVASTVSKEIGEKAECAPGLNNMFTDIRGNLDWICNITGVCPTEEAAEDWNSRGTELPPVNPSTNNDWSDYYETTVEPEPWTPNYWWE